MKMVLTKAAALGLFLTSSTGALAQALQWRVSESAGPVTVWTGNQKHPAVRGVLLKPGDSVHAGPGARAVLVHDRDFVTVSANSRVTVPTPEKATGFVKLLQDWGNAVFRIEKLGKPHFGVNTPSLAAVVKGTTFSITVDGTGTSLQVTEGLVEVATLDGGARDLIRAGGVANIFAADPMRLNIRGEAARVIDSPARPQASQAAEQPAPQASEAPRTDTEPAPAGADAVTAAVVIEAPIASKPVDLGAVTRGLVTGSAAAVQMAAVTADVRTTSREVQQAPETSPDVIDNGSAGSSGSAGSKDESSKPATGAPNDNSNGSGNGNAGTGPGSSGPGDQGNGNGSGSDNAGSGNPGNGNSSGARGDGAAPGNSGNAPGKDDKASPGKSDNAPGKDDKAPGNSGNKADDQAAKDAEKAAKEAEKAAKDAEKAADKAADEAGKDADKAAKEAEKAADKAADDAAKDADKAAKEAEKAADKAADDAAKDADKAAKEAEKAADKAADDAAKDADKAAKEADKAATNDAGSSSSGPGKLKALVEKLTGGLVKPN